MSSTWRCSRPPADLSSAGFGVNLNPERMVMSTKRLGVRALSSDHGHSHRLGADHSRSLAPRRRAGWRCPARRLCTRSAGSSSRPRCGFGERRRAEGSLADRHGGRKLLGEVGAERAVEVRDPDEEVRSAGGAGGIVGAGHVVDASSDAGNGPGRLAQLSPSSSANADRNQSGHPLDGRGGLRNDRPTVGVADQQDRSVHGRPVLAIASASNASPRRGSLAP